MVYERRIKQVVDCKVEVDSRKILGLLVTDFEVKKLCLVEANELFSFGTKPWHARMFLVSA